MLAFILKASIYTDTRYTLLLLSLLLLCVIASIPPCDCEQCVVCVFFSVRSVATTKSCFLFGGLVHIARSLLSDMILCKGLISCYGLTNTTRNSIQSVWKERVRTSAWRTTTRTRNTLKHEPVNIVYSLIIPIIYRPYINTYRNIICIHTF